MHWYIDFQELTSKLIPLFSENKGTNKFLAFTWLSFFLSSQMYFIQTEIIITVLRSCFVIQLWGESLWLLKSPSRMYHWVEKQVIAWYLEVNTTSFLYSEE